jgi:chorismate dehydratase
MAAALSDSTGSRRPRLGAVSFLNTRPLTYGLTDADFELVYEVPSRCADALAAGRIDAGLIPVAAYARQADRLAGACIVPGVAIGATGDVLTVRLFYRGDLRDIRRIAADTSSRTSVVLLRILLAERYGLTPEVVPAAPDLDAMLHEADAALLIGDPVLPLVEAPEAGERRSLDLAREWIDLTQTPFVFAFWAGPEGALTRAHVQRLQRARREGEANLGPIAAAFQRERAGSAELYERYLRDHICYDLGAAQIDGLTTFFRLGRQQGLLPGAPDLRFYPES